MLLERLFDEAPQGRFSEHERTVTLGYLKALSEESAESRWGGAWYWWRAGFSFIVAVLAKGRWVSSRATARGRSHRIWLTIGRRSSATWPFRPELKAIWVPPRAPVRTARAGTSTELVSTYRTASAADMAAVVVDSGAHPGRRPKTRANTTKAMPPVLNGPSLPPSGSARRRHE